MRLLAAARNVDPTVAALELTEGTVGKDKVMVLIPRLTIAFILAIQDEPMTMSASHSVVTLSRMGTGVDSPRFGDSRIDASM